MNSQQPDSGSVSRALWWRPRTYPQAWLFAVGLGLAVLAIIAVFGVSNGWRRPWPVFAIEMTLTQFAGWGLSLSYGVHRRRRASHSG